MYGWSSVLKTSTALIVGIFEQICCFGEVFLMALTSREQLFIERPLYKRLFQNLCKKILLPCYKLELCHVSEAATGGVLLEKVFLEILQNSQENTCGTVSFIINLHAEVTASDLSRAFSWKFLACFISTEKWNEKREIPCWSSNISFFCSSIDLIDVKDFTRNLTDDYLIKECV